MDGSVREDFETIMRRLRELERIYCTAIGRSDISENEFWIWYTLLAFHGEYSQQDINEIWSLPKQTTNTIISNMVKKGYVTLQAIPGTRNRKCIRLTGAGRAYGEGLVMPIYDAERRAAGRLPEGERQACIAAIGQYIDILRDELHGQDRDRPGSAGK